MVEGGYQRPALFLLEDAVEAHGMDALEDVEVFPMARRPPMRVDEALHLFEGRNDPLFARGADRDLLGLDDDAERVEQRTVLVGELLSH